MLPGVLGFTGPMRNYDFVCVNSYELFRWLSHLRVSKSVLRMDEKMSNIVSLQKCIGPASVETFLYIAPLRAYRPLFDRPL